MAENHPELKTVAMLNPDRDHGRNWSQASRETAESHGVTVISEDFYEPATQDFYPVLTSIVAANPDSIDIGAAPDGQGGLIVKQARELGYTGIIQGPSLTSLDFLIMTADDEHVSGVWLVDQDLTSPAYPDKMHTLVAEWEAEWRKPGEIYMNLCTAHGVGILNSSRRA